MIKRFTFSGAVALGLLSTSALSADPWVVRRAKTSGQCWVFKATAAGNHAPDVLTRQDGRRAACTAAKQLRTDDISESKRCFAYAPDTIAACKIEKVPLP